jgi:hypothetical protein
MNRIIERRIEKIKKQLNCSMDKCGTQFKFEIDEEKYKNVKNDMRFRYLGKCKRCQKILKLSTNSIQALNIGFGVSEFKVTKNKFNDLFEIKK